MLDSDLDVLFFGPDAVDVTVGANSFKGLLDSPDESIADGMVISAEYVLTVKTSDISDLADLAEISVAGEQYEARKPLKIDDGRLSKVTLSKVDP